MSKIQHAEVMRAAARVASETFALAEKEEEARRREAERMEQVTLQASMLEENIAGLIERVSEKGHTELRYNLGLKQNVYPETKAHLEQLLSGLGYSFRWEEKRYEGTRGISMALAAGGDVLDLWLEITW